MKNSQEKHNNSFDEYEDLTLFADESFDTGDVDLFEFSSEDDSILTRLKSIILSLDWEINDEILQELTDEVQLLQEQWQDDKVAEVYLQGLDKIGRYIGSKGAYAHPNAIKLLLTFYYNFEKITSSENITQEEIALLLKGDVRKFRILQYQVNQGDESAPVVTAMEKPVLLQDDAEEKQVINHTEKDHLKLLKASILSLDWEVTEESLQQFSMQLDHFHQVLADDKPAMVLVQGLRALGEYISESGAAAHPESFTLLHAFAEGLEQVLYVDADKRDKHQLQALLVDRIGRLNALKALIVEQPSPPSEQIVDGLVEEMAPTEPAPEPSPDVSPVQSLQEFTAEQTTEAAEDYPGNIEAELDELFPVEHSPAMETSDTKYPDEILSPDAIHPISNNVADEYIETELRSKRDLAPALSESDEIFGFNEDTEPLDVPAQSDLNDQLDKLFDNDIFGDDAEQETVTASDNEQEPALADEEPLDVALANFDFSTDAEGAAEAGEKEEELDLDIESELDSFFSEKDSGADAETEPPLHIDEQESGIIPALADSSDEQGFSIDESMESLSQSPLGDIEEKLDFFFDEDDDEASLPDTTVGDAEENFEDTLDFFEQEDKERELLDSALSAATAPTNLAAQQNADQENELEEQLDFFFDASEDDEEEPGLELTSPLPAFSETQPAEQEETPPAPVKEEKEVYLAALGAVLPSTVRAPTDEGIAEAAKLITELKEHEQGTEEKVLVRLMGGIIDQLVHSRFIDLAATEKVVNVLFEQLSRPSLSSEDMTNAMEQYLGWQTEAVATIAQSTQPGLVLPTATPTPQPVSEKVTPSLSPQSELRLIKDMIQDEFNQLRDELKKVPPAD